MNRLKSIRLRVATAWKKRDYKTNLPAFVWFLVRYAIYGCFGMVNELIFTNVIRLVQKINFISPFFGDFYKMSFFPGVPTQNDQMGWTGMAMFSMTSFWLFFVYGTGIYLVEKLYKLFGKRTCLLDKTCLDKKNKKEIPLSRLKRLLYCLIRLGVYTLVICAVEFLFGWIYRFLFNNFVWEYESFLRTTSVAMIPFWFGSTYLVEIIVRKFGDSELEQAFLSADDDKITNIFSNYTGKATINLDWPHKQEKKGA